MTMAQPNPNSSEAQFARIRAIPAYSISLDGRCRLANGTNGLPVWQWEIYQKYALGSMVTHAYEYMHLAMWKF